MDLSGAGTAIMLAIAAALWFVYLVPTWIRRREYLATERTATRIQQTLRVLAETAEVPDAVRVTASSRDAARAARAARSVRRAEVKARLAAEREPARPESLPAAAIDAMRRRRIRRTRLLASLLMLGATALGVVQIWLMATTGITLGGWFVLAGTLAASGLAIAVQRRLDQRTMPRPAAAPRHPARPRNPAALDERVPARPASPAPWTPVPLPQPLYLSRPAAPPRAVPAVAAAPAAQGAPAAHAASAAPSASAAEPARIRPADTRPAAGVAPLRQDPPAELRARSGFAAMGIIDPADTAVPDLDEVLRRRRSAG